MNRVSHGLARLRGRLPRGSVIAGIVALDDPAARQLFAADGRARAVIDRTGRLLAANPHFDRLLALAVPVAGAVVERLAPEGRVAAWQAIEAAMARGAPADAGVATWWRTDGSPCRAGLFVSPIREGDGRISGAVLQLHDATDEDARDAANLNARKLQAVGALAGGVAHDFNNLLQAIGAAAESLSNRPCLPVEAQKEVSHILAGAQRGAALVRQLLAFSRQQTLQPQIVAVNAAITALAGLLRRTLGERVRLDVQLESPGRTVRVDPGQLDQVLVNLAVNARDAMAEGGVLSLRTVRRTILAPQASGAEVIPPGRYVVIEVADTGQGIPPEVMPRIFEPFFTTRMEHGTGLGLATVLGIVRQSGGFIEVDSTPGAGTTVRILLPRSNEAAPAEPPPAASSPAPPILPRPGKLLLVEDEDVVRRLATRALERLGWEVVAAENAEAALEQLDLASPPDCVVTDMVMPGIDGAALLRALRERLGRPLLPALIVSGYAEPHRHDEIGAVATSYLAKPYAMRDLAARVAALTSTPPAAVVGSLADAI